MMINKSLGDILKSTMTSESRGPGKARLGLLGHDPASPPASPAAVHHHGHQVVHAVQVHGVAGRVEEPELQREDHPVRQLGVSVQLLHVLEPLQVQGQDHGQLFHSHPKKPQTDHQLSPAAVRGREHAAATRTDSRRARTGFNPAYHTPLASLKGGVLAESWLHRLSRTTGGTASESQVPPQGAVLVWSKETVPNFCTYKK